MKRIAVILALLMVFSVSVDSKVKKTTTKKTTTTAKTTKAKKAVKTTSNKSKKYNSLEELAKAAADGDADSQYQLSEILISSPNDEDKKLGLILLLEAADNGDSRAQVAAAALFNNLNDFEKSFKYFKMAADQGDTDSQSSLGSLYATGKGVAQDHKQAVYWFKKAAEKGNANAQVKLGACYAKGKGVAQDYKQAVYWFKKAAEKGNANAQEFLGSCYFHGEGVAKDNKQAVYWLKKAAEKGNADAQELLGFCYFHGEGVAKDNKQAVYWYKKAAEKGNAEAQAILGVCYIEGNGVDKDQDKGLELIKKAADQGHSNAQKLLNLVSANSLKATNNNLVAFYPFNGNANDESGNGNNGTVIGNVTLTSDRHGKANSAYRFPGQAFNYISVPDNETLHLSTFTLNAWVYTDANNYGSNYVICKGRDITNGSYSLGASGVGAVTQYGGANGASMKSIPSVKTWHMVTGVVEGKTARFYLDGVLVDERTLSYNFVYNNTETMAIGMHYFSGVPSRWAYPYLGIIDDVRIYNRVLSNAEIQSLYNE